MSITETQLLEQGKKACYETFEHDKALKLYEEAIKLNPDFANAYAEKANVLRYLHKYEQAIVFANKSIDLDFNCWLGYFQKIRALMHLQKKEEAEEIFTNFIADFYLRNPEQYDENEEFLFHLSNVLSELKHSTEAIESFDQLIRINNSNPVYYANKSCCLNSLSLFEEAIECINKAIELNPNYANAYQKKAIYFYNLERYEEALECANKAIELNPNDYLFYDNKANCFYNLERYEEAVKYYDKAIELNPNDLDSKKWREEALKQQSLKRDK